MSEIQSIAQNNYILHNIDAKKLYVQEPLFTANSGDAVYVGWRPDETVLWSGNTYSGTCNEDVSGFERIKAYCRDDGFKSTCIEIYDPENCHEGGNTYSISTTANNENGLRTFQLKFTGNDFVLYGSQQSIGTNRTINWVDKPSTNNGYTFVQKIIGINRKENA